MATTPNQPGGGATNMLPPGSQFQESEMRAMAIASLARSAQRFMDLLERLEKVFMDERAEDRQKEK